MTSLNPTGNQRHGLGEVAEWSKANDSKSFEGKPSVGSNPTLSVLERFLACSHLQGDARRYGLWDHNLGDTSSAAAGRCCWWWIGRRKYCLGRVISLVLNYTVALGQ